MNGGASSPEGAPELSVRDIVVEFRGRQGERTSVLAGVSFDVRREEFVTVMGPSGAGKSTLLNVMAGFLRPSAGQALYRGQPITGPGAERGVVFQTPALYPWLTVLDNVMFGPRANGRTKGARELARGLLAEVGLTGFENHYPYELSGGMKHRVALARTLANRPPVLLMDEPFAALDAQTRGEMQSLLLSVWEHHRSTVVFVTHDIEEGLLLADRALVLSHRPSTIKERIAVPWPRPRSYDLVLSQEFVRLRGEVRALMQRDSGRSEPAAGHEGA